VSEVATDAKGRKLTLRKLNILDQVRLLRAIGPSQASNQPYYDIVMAAASVSDIDGLPIPMPTNERQIDAAIARIGDEGFAALMVHMQRQIAEVQAAAEAAADEAADGEANPADPLVPSA
jgi:hypothetical protein